MKENKTFPVCAQFLDTFYPVVDGVVKTVDNYCRIINKESYCCAVVPKNDSLYEDNFPYDVIRAHSVRFPSFEYALPFAAVSKEIKAKLDEKDFKLFHTHSPFFLGHYALEEAKKRNIKIITTFHSKYYDDVLKITNAPPIADFVVKYIVSFYNKVDSVWTVSESTAEVLRSYGYKGDIFIAENGTNFIFPKNANELKKEAKAKYNLVEGEPTLLFIGHQIWQKNLKLVLDTAKELSNRKYKFKMLIVGSGYAKNQILSYAKKLDLLDKEVRFLGQIDEQDEIKALGLASDLFFFPSIYDNAPLVVREAAAMGLPSLLMKDSNAAEPIIDGENGFLCIDDPVATADIIEKIFSQKDKLKEVGQKAKETLGKSWDEIMPKIRDKYLEIIES